MSRVEENKLLKKKSLMDTAFQLFTSQGLGKTSIADIAQRAGVAKGTFYLYFKDKYDLHERLVVRKSEELFSHAMAHSGYETQTTPEDKILAIGSRGAGDRGLYRARAGGRKLLQRDPGRRTRGSGALSPLSAPIRAGHFNGIPPKLKQNPALFREEQCGVSFSYRAENRPTWVGKPPHPGQKTAPK